MRDAMCPPTPFTKVVRGFYVPRGGDIIKIKDLRQCSSIPPTLFLLRWITHALSLLRPRSTTAAAIRPPPPLPSSSSSGMRNLDEQDR